MSFLYWDVHLVLLLHGPQGDLVCNWSSQWLRAVTPFLLLTSSVYNAFSLLLISKFTCGAFSPFTNVVSASTVWFNLFQTFLFLLCFHCPCPWSASPVVARTLWKSNQIMSFFFTLVFLNAREFILCIWMSDKFLSFTCHSPSSHWCSFKGFCLSSIVASIFLLGPLYWLTLPPKLISFHTFLGGHLHFSICFLHTLYNIVQVFLAYLL